MPVLLYIMENQIEYYEIPEECQIELQIGNKTQILDCRVDLSHDSIVSEVYDNAGNIIATSMDDLVKLGVAKATVIQKHEVDLSEAF